MNATEFRAVLNWWMANDPKPIPASENEIVASWLHNESVQRGYIGIIDAYHRHESLSAPKSDESPGPMELIHSDELRRIASMDSCSWDYAQKLMRSAADEIERLTKGWSEAFDIALRNQEELKRLRDAAPNAGNAALGPLGELMLRDYIIENSNPTRGEIAMHLMANDWTEHNLRDAAERAVKGADALIKSLARDYVESNYTVDNVLNFLDERAEWLDREMYNGGTRNTCVKYEECRYIAKCIRDTRDRLNGAQS